MASALNHQPWRVWTDAVLRSYSQVFFSRSRVVGGLMIVATAFEPRIMMYGLLAVLIAVVTARSLRFDEQLVTDGIYSYNALLVGVGTAALLPSDTTALAILVAGSVLSVLVTAASRSGTATNGLPILTAPFLAVYFLIVATATSLGLSLALLPTGPDPGLFPDWLTLYFKSLGMIFFVPRLDAGFVLFVALLFHSRIATLFSVAGLFVAYGVMQVSALSVLAGDVFPMLLALNLMFTAIALGGVWFVPSRSSMLLAMTGAVVAAAMTISTAPMLARFGLPILILPFNVTIWLVLFALRQRTQDGVPKSVEFVPGTPEENFVYHRTHVLRFGAHYATRIRAPFGGVWTCTQGVDGPHTHKGMWKHAFDFEVAGSDGALFDGEGTQPKDYHCYNLPVLAPAAGTVVEVVNDVRDNLIGEPNVDQNWGNLVLIYHAPGLYSMVCHLVPGSVTVREGEWVAPGQVIGKCGNSGRSPTPHLHFQLQAVPQVGAPTIYAELHDVIRDAESSELISSAIVQEGERFRNIRVDTSLQSLFASFKAGSRFTLDNGKAQEQVEVRIDLFGRTILESDKGATLFFEIEDDRFLVFDVVGPRASALHVLRAALGRVPFDDKMGITWTDHLPLGLVYGPIVRTAYEFVAPFIDKGGVEVNYSIERDGTQVIVAGTTLVESGKPPAMTTQAVFEPGVGLVEVSTQTARGPKTRVQILSAKESS